MREMVAALLRIDIADMGECVARVTEKLLRSELSLKLP